MDNENGLSESKVAVKFDVSRDVIAQYRGPKYKFVDPEKRNKYYFYTDKDIETLKRILALRTLGIKKTEMSKVLEADNIASEIFKKLSKGTILKKKKEVDTRLSIFYLLQEAKDFDWNELENIIDKGKEEQKDMWKEHYNLQEVIVQRDLSNITDELIKNAESAINNIIAEARERCLEEEGIQDELDCQFEDELQEREDEMREGISDELNEEGYEEDFEDELEDRLNIQMKEITKKLQEEFKEELKARIDESIDLYVEEEIQNYLKEVARQRYPEAGLDFIELVDSSWRPKMSQYLWNEYEKSELSLGPDERFILGIILFNKPIQIGEANLFYKGSYRDYLKENYHQIKEVIEFIKSQHNVNFINHLSVQIVQETLEEVKEKYSNLFKSVNILSLN